MKNFTKSANMRRSLYSLDPEKFDHIFIREWRRVEPKSNGDFAEYLNDTGILPTLRGAKAWTRHSVNNHVQRLAAAGIQLKYDTKDKLYILEDGNYLEIPNTWT